MPKSKDRIPMVIYFLITKTDSVNYNQIYKIDGSRIFKNVAVN